MPKEDVIVTNILKYINSQPQGVAEKIQGSALSSGKADINGCYKGHSIRIEVKTPDHGNKPSKKQQLNLKRWRHAGAFCISAYSLEDAKNLLADIDRFEEEHV